MTSAATTVSSYTPAQRGWALLYGLLSHGLFLAAVVVMFVSLYRGLHGSLLHLQGWLAVVGMFCSSPSLGWDILCCSQIEADGG